MKKPTTKEIILFVLLTVLQFYPIFERTFFPYFNFWYRHVFGLFLIPCSFSLIFLKGKYKIVKITLFSLLLVSAIAEVIFIFVSILSLLGNEIIGFYTIVITLLMSFQIHFLVILILMYLSYVFEYRVEIIKKVTMIYLIVFALFYTFINFGGIITGPYSIFIHNGRSPADLHVLLLTLAIVGQVYVSIFSMFVFRSFVFKKQILL